MHKRIGLVRISFATLIVIVFAVGVASIAHGTPVPCPLPDPDAAADCPQTVLQPQICGGNCRYVNECHALAAGWKRNHCESAIGFSREAEIPS